MNYYERHIGDYLKDTAHLQLLEHGVYARLLDVYYTRENGIPDKDAARLIGARSKDEKAALVAVLEEFFTLAEGTWVQDRCQREILRYQDKQAKAKRSAQARWNSEHAQSEGNANAFQNEDTSGMRTHSEGNALQSPDTKHQIPPSSEGGKRAARAPAPARPDDVSEQTWNDWLQLRKSKKAPVTATVLEGARAEAEKAALTLDRFLAVWCTRGSQGLQADWLKPHERGIIPTNKHSAAAAAIFGRSDRQSQEVIDV